MADEHRAFFFNVDKWRGSRAVGRMSFAERGVYFEMMLEQWEKKSVPDDLAAVVESIAVTDAQAAEVVAAWPAVRRKFATSKHSPGRMYNVELENTRRKQRANLRAKQVAGSIAGKASAAKRQSKRDLGVNERSTVVDERSTVVNRSDLIRSDLIRGVAPPVDARSKRPIYQSDRFVVFEWQLDDLGRMLGSQLDNFDLHAFFDGLSQQSRTQGLVIAREDVWAWLQAQVKSEAKRRGLPMAGATVVAKPSGCRHVPPCVDDATHTAKFMKEKAS